MKNVLKVVFVGIELYVKLNRLEFIFVYITLQIKKIY